MLGEQLRSTEPRRSIPQATPACFDSLAIESLQWRAVRISLRALPNRTVQAGNGQNPNDDGRSLTTFKKDLSNIQGLPQGAARNQKRNFL